MVFGCATSVRCGVGFQNVASQTIREVSCDRLLSVGDGQAVARETANLVGVDCSWQMAAAVEIGQARLDLLAKANLYFFVFGDRNSREFGG
jgi:hypothetical protein